MPELLTVTGFVPVGSFDAEGENLLDHVLEMVRSLKEEYPLLKEYLLADIGFLGHGDLVEIRLYFRRREEDGLETPKEE